MNNVTDSPNASKPSPVNYLRHNWLNFRKKRFWVLVALLLYTLAGFVLVPHLVHKKLTELLNIDLGRQAHIENIDFNPFVLSLRIQGFELDDKDQVQLASFGQFFVNFQLSSLFNRAWTFDEISLNEPYFLIERFNTKDSRITRLLEDFTKSHPPETDKPEPFENDGGIPELLIHDLVIQNGKVDLKDNLADTSVETQLAPINISVQALNTLPDRNGKQTVTIQLAEGANLNWDGTISLDPLDSKGELVLENLHLDPITAYLRESMPIDSLSSTLSTRLNYHVSMGQDGQLRIDISELQIDLHDIAIKALTPGTEIINVSDISLMGGQFQYPEQRVQFSKINIENPHLVAWLIPDGMLSLMDLAPASSTTADNEATSADQNAWYFGIENFQLNGGVIEFSDKTLPSPSMLELRDIAVSLSGFNNQAGTAMPVQLGGTLRQGGSFKAEGSFSLLPEFEFSSHISTSDLPLRLSQPYVEQIALIDIVGGTMNSEIDVQISKVKNLAMSGSALFPSLDIRNQQDDSNLLGWSALKIDRFEFEQDSNKLSFSQLTFEELFGTFGLDENKVTNLSKLIIEQPEKNADTSRPPLGLVIGGVLINNSSMDFSDLSLPLPFATHIVKLNGSISTIDTSSEEPANINLEGQVDEYGLARISGSLNVFDPINHTDMTLKFRNLMMSNLSPYTVEFAGRAINKGKLDLELVYAIDKGLLNGTNKVDLSDLELGNKVDHPDAASLPLGLAVSLLKDADGVIKVDLPVEGDVNDPEFQISGVIWKAFSGFIGKIVSAPFRLLGNLIGIDSEDIGQFEFLAGRADLTPPEMEKIAQLELALQQRPALTVEVAGVYDTAMDTAALKKSKLLARATQRLGQEIGADDTQTFMLDEQIRTLVETMHAEHFQNIDRDAIKAEFTAPPASDPQGKAELDELAYASALWEQMIEAEPVTIEDLEMLANARSKVIHETFLASGEFGESRINLATPKEVESEDGNWVILELSVASED